MDDISPLRLAFGHEARVGKDTAGEYLKNKYGGETFSFAKPLYEILYYAQNICGFNKQKDRTFLQMVGTWARNIDEDTWVNIMKRNIEENSDKNIFITDVRYPNEFSVLKELGFTLVKITRDADKGMTNAQQSHSSENSLFGADWDIMLENNGTIDEFYIKLDLLADR